MRLKGHTFFFYYYFFKAPQPRAGGGRCTHSGSCRPPGETQNSCPGAEIGGLTPPERPVCARAEPGRAGASSSLTCPHGGTQGHQRPPICHQVHPPSRKIPELPPRPLRTLYSYRHANPGHKAPPSDAVTKGLSWCNKNPAAVRLGRLPGSGL